jgi:hypothetical protein
VKNKIRLVQYVKRYSRDKTRKVTSLAMGTLLVL